MNEEPENTPDGRVSFWLHQQESPHQKEMVHVGFCPEVGKVLTLYVGPKQITEVEVLGVEASSLFVRHAYGINHYLHVLQLVAVELYQLPPDLRNSLAAELTHALEWALTDEQPISKAHCDELMRIVKLVREEKRLEGVPNDRSLTRPADEPADRRPARGRDDVPPEQVPDGDGIAER